MYFIFINKNCLGIPFVKMNKYVPFGICKFLLILIKYLLFNIGIIVIFFILMTLMDLNSTKIVLGLFFDLKGEIINSGRDKIDSAVEVKI